MTQLLRYHPINRDSKNYQLKLDHLLIAATRKGNQNVVIILLKKYNNLVINAVMMDKVMDINIILKLVPRKINVVILMVLVNLANQKIRRNKRIS